MEFLPEGGGGGGGVFFALEGAFEAGSEGGIEFDSEGVVGANDEGNGGAVETGGVGSWISFGVGGGLLGFETGVGGRDGGLGGLKSGFCKFDSGCSIGVGEDLFRFSSIVLSSSLLELMSARKGNDPCGDTGDFEFEVDELDNLGTAGGADGADGGALVLGIGGAFGADGCDTCFDEAEVLGLGLEVFEDSLFFVVDDGIESTT